MKRDDHILLNENLPVTAYSVVQNPIVFDHFLNHIAERYCPFITTSINAKGFFNGIIKTRNVGPGSVEKQVDEYTKEFIHHVYNKDVPKHFYCLCLRFETPISDDALNECVIALEAKYKRMGVLFGKFFRDRIFRANTEDAIITPESFLVVRFVTGASDQRFYSDKIPFAKPSDKNPLL